MGEKDGRGVGETDGKEEVGILVDGTAVGQTVLGENVGPVGSKDKTGVKTGAYVGLLFVGIEVGIVVGVADGAEG